MLRDVRVVRWVIQFVAVGLLVLLLRWLWGNITTNSKEGRIRTGWSFLNQRAGFPIPDKTNEQFSPAQPMKDAFIEGLQNTLRLAVAGIVLATLLGVLLGVARLSTNAIVRTGARVYVEFVRNVPLLALIYLVYLAVVQRAFPEPANSWRLGNLAILNQNGSNVVWFEGSYLAAAVIFVVAVLAVAAVVFARRRSSARTGALPRSGFYGAAAFLAVVVIGSTIAGFEFTTPQLDDGRVTGGITMTPTYFGALVALVLYTSSHIAEIVRGSIQAVPNGQSEAANALALSGFQRLWHVVLPQAMRIAVPPLGNQYLNLTKNTSLAAIISYGELTKVVRLGNSNSVPPVPSFLLLLAIYLGLSLCISLLVNVVNWRLKLVER